PELPEHLLEVHDVHVRGLVHVREEARVRRLSFGTKRTVRLLHPVVDALARYADREVERGAQDALAVGRVRLAVLGRLEDLGREADEDAGVDGADVDLVHELVPPGLRARGDALMLVARGETTGARDGAALGGLGLPDHAAAIAVAEASGRVEEHLAVPGA